MIKVMSLQFSIKMIYPINETRINNNNLKHRDNLQKLNGVEYLKTNYLFFSNGSFESLIGH